jgi:uncharacterized Fe-S center protein
MPMPASKIYFIKLNELNKIKDLLPEFTSSLGVKVHFGEEGNKTFVPAELIKPIIDMVGHPTLIECSVLYRSPRSKALTHRKVALKHGFGFAPIDFLDGPEGDDCLEVKIKGKYFERCYLGKGLEKYKSLLVISHFKGHGGSGFGGALKNIGMGLASRRGKLAIHSSIQHSVNQKKCTGCGTCIKNCPVNAISLDKGSKAVINREKCVSCSKCISVCPVEAIAIPWSSHGRQVLSERIAEYALAVSRKRQCFFVNFLINITSNCDCLGDFMEKLTEDIGVLISSDPVAIDQASYDLVCRQFVGFKEFSGEYQLEHAESIGLGKRAYDLIG